MLSYKKTNGGEKNLLIFHGFGQDQNAFASYLKILKPQYTVYSFDIFYHGKSNRADYLLTISEWCENLKSILLKENINQFSLLSFSLGGRFCLASATIFSSQIDNLIMLAPDGIYQSFWYKTSKTSLGNIVFRYFIKNETRFNKLIKSINLLGLASPSLIRFVEKEVNTQARRDQVYLTWTYFQKLQLKKSVLKTTIERIKKPTHIILGKLDLIVRESDIKKKTSGFNKVKLHSIRAKHGQMIDQSKTLVSSLLLGE